MSLHFFFVQDLMKPDVIFSDDEKLKHSAYFLQFLLPVLKQINEEQMLEKELEAKKCGTLLLVIWKVILIFSLLVMYLFLTCVVNYYCSRAGLCYYSFQFDLMD